MGTDYGRGGLLRENEAARCRLLPCRHWISVLSTGHPNVRCDGVHITFGEIGSPASRGHDCPLFDSSALTPDRIVEPKSALMGLPSCNGMFWV